MKFEIVQAKNKQNHSNGIFLYLDLPKDAHNNYPYIDYNFSGNCQISTIAWFNQFYVNVFSFSEKEKKPLHICFFEAYVNSNMTPKNALLLDVKDNDLSKVDEFFPKNLFERISETKYTSTNGSSMNLILINIRNEYTKFVD
jgi:hypothetical protein